DPAAILENSTTPQVVTLSGITVGRGDTGQNLTVTATSNNTNLIPNPTIIYTSPNGTGSLSYVPVNNANGTATITVTVTDDGGTTIGGADTVTQKFNVTVTPVNQQPSFMASDPPAVSEDSGPQSVVNFASFNPGAPNESNQTAAYIVSSVTNPGLFAVPPA